MNDRSEFIVVAVVLFGCVLAAFALGTLAGRHAQCETLGAEYQKGKCVIVDRKEVKL